ASWYWNARSRPFPTNCRMVTRRWYPWRPARRSNGAWLEPDRESLATPETVSTGAWTAHMKTAPYKAPRLHMYAAQPPKDGLGEFCYLRRKSTSQTPCPRRSPRVSNLV